MFIVFNCRPSMLDRIRGSSKYHSLLVLPEVKLKIYLKINYFVIYKKKYLHKIFLLIYR